jgi:transcriptional regulator with GAF, ATPase, and Fis domain
MEIIHWICSCAEIADQKRELLKQALVRQGLKADLLQPGLDASPSVYLFSEITLDLQRRVQVASRGGLERVIAIAESERPDRAHDYWDLLRAGASDILVWSTPEATAREIKARFDRWRSIEQLLEEPVVRALVVAKSPIWRTVLRDVAEISRFGDATVLLLGESGTGKEVAARLIHLLDPRPDKRDLVLLDCSTITPELSGSEFFGHERGSFTGASSERQGAFALANGGTLFLDEIGELPLALQAQLLRVIQERTYKRVGGNVWQRTAFRLVCATNRDLQELVRRGGFRSDLYYRIAGCICHLPPLRERLEDIVPLAEHFLRDATRTGDPPKLDVAVRNYLLQRDYPGNVRDLKQVLMRIMSRHPGEQTVTIGSIPSDERPAGIQREQVAWLDSNFEQQIHRAVLFGAGLKEIGRAAEEIAIRYATAEEKGNVHRAACRLGVTDRTLQLRRATRRQADEPRGLALTPVSDRSGMGSTRGGERTIARPRG